MSWSNLTSSKLKSPFVQESAQARSSGSKAELRFQISEHGLRNCNKNGESKFLRPAGWKVWSLGVSSRVLFTTEERAVPIPSKFGRTLD